MNRFFYFFFIVLGIIGILDSICTVAYSTTNFGNLFPAVVGIILILFSIFHKNIFKFAKSKLGRIMTMLFSFGLIFFAVTFTAFYFTAENFALKTPQKPADAIVVLGAGLDGDQVSKTLSLRLLKAKEYFDKNNDSVIVVTGGQGPRELVSEAFAMNNYLIDLGIPKDKIFMENKSTSTKENFKFAKDILDNYFKEKDYSIIYVTNDFHLYRAGLIAKDFGFNAQGLASKSDPVLLPNFYIREYFSMIKYILTSFL